MTSKPYSFRLLTLALLAAFSFGACISSAPTATPPTSPAVTAPAATGAFPLTIIDDAGREVTLSAKPERIISLLPSNTETLFAVGAGEQVVGVTSYCNYPPEAATRKQVGGITVQSISVETIIALEPDLVLTNPAQAEIAETLTESGLPVVVLDPASLEDIYANIELVGQVTGHPDEAAMLVTELRNRAEAVKKAVAAIPEEEQLSVFYEVWHDPLMTAGPNTVIGQIIDLAGGRNIFADVAEDWPQVSAEVVLTRNPAIILGPESHGSELTVEKIAARPGWDNIDAVKNDRVYLLDPDAVSRPGPRIIGMLEEIARDLYPDQF